MSSLYPVKQAPEIKSSSIIFLSHSINILLSKAEESYNYKIIFALKIYERERYLGFHALSLEFLMQI